MTYRFSARFVFGDSGDGLAPPPVSGLQEPILRLKLRSKIFFNGLGAGMLLINSGFCTSWPSFCHNDGVAELHIVGQIAPKRDSIGGQTLYGNIIVPKSEVEPKFMVVLVDGAEHALLYGHAHVDS